MSNQHESLVTCSMCFNDFDVRRSKTILSRRRLKSHEVYQCPHCNYLVAVVRPVVTA